MEPHIYEAVCGLWPREKFQQENSKLAKKSVWHQFQNLESQAILQLCIFFVLKENLVEVVAKMLHVIGF